VKECVQKGTDTASTFASASAADDDTKTKTKNGSGGGDDVSDQMRAQLRREGPAALERLDAVMQAAMNGETGDISKSRRVSASTIKLYLGSVVPTFSRVVCLFFSFVFLSRLCLFVYYSVWVTTI
jgi:hypothetical protein